MGIFTDYKEYTKYLPDYKPWKDKRNLDEAKKLKYLKQNPVDVQTRARDIQRGQVLLNAIDIMDEYSQSKAENMEVMTTQAIAAVAETASYAGMAVGGVLAAIPPIAKSIDKFSAKLTKKIFKKEVKGAFPKLYFAMGVGMIASLATNMLMQGWAASQQVAASRRGRFEAMKNELQDVRKFAVLTDEQLAKQAEIAEKMPTTKAMKKGNLAKKSNLLNPLTSLSMLGEILNPDTEKDEERKLFDDKLNEIPQIMPKLSEKDILDAKKDQQLVLNIAEKVDMASQDYSENTELVVGALTTTALAGGLLTGYLANTIIKKLKITNQNAIKYAPLGVGAAVGIALSILATSIQKQAARVGRFKAKQELAKNPDNFIYLSQEKTDVIPDNIKVATKKKPNLFSFTIQAIKDNFEYKKYLKTEGIKEKKKILALKDIELTEEQFKDAQRLQKNTFKVFNKIDEKSQRYAESVEAVGETINIPIAAFSSLAGLGLGCLYTLKNAKKLKNNMFPLPMIIGMFVGVLPAIIVNAIFTKKEKEASRVAHMLAMNEMQDYKKFIDFETTK